MEMTSLREMQISRSSALQLKRCDFLSLSVYSSRAYCIEASSDVSVVLIDDASVFEALATTSAGSLRVLELVEKLTRRENVTRYVRDYPHLSVDSK